MYYSLIKQNTGHYELLNIGYVTYIPNEDFIKIFILEDLSIINSVIKNEFKINTFLLLYLIKLKFRIKGKKRLLDMMNDILLIGSSKYYRSETLFVAKATLRSSLFYDNFDKDILKEFGLVYLFQELSFKEIKININDLDNEIKKYGAEIKN